MTEKEKCRAGLLYDANYDPQLLAERRAAKELLYDYNRLRPSEEAERLALLKRLLGRTGEQCIIEPPFACDYGYNIEVGENFFANFNLVILDEARVSIGDNAFIAPNVAIYTAGHPLDVGQRNRGLEYARPVTIGHNVWIGGNVVILPGVTIGDGSVVGAGSIVTRDIPPMSFAAGSPCRVIREITEADSMRNKPEILADNQVTPDSKS